MAYAKSIDTTPAKDQSARFRELCPDLEHYFFYPTPSCDKMLYAARSKDRFKKPASKNFIASPRMIVLFDWDQRGRPDHCGIVEKASAGALTTIEFNTSQTIGDQRNGGVIARKTRDYKFVFGFITLSTSVRRP